MIKNNIPLNIPADRNNIISNEYCVEGPESNDLCENCSIKNYILEIMKKWHSQKFMDLTWLTHTDGREALMELHIALMNKEAEVFAYLNKNENCSCENK